MTSTFFVLNTFGVIFLALGLHPFITYPLSLLFLPGLRRDRAVPPNEGGENLRYAICVCAYNEEEGIVAKVENLLELKKSVRDCQILIYIDGKTDRTYERLQPYRDAVTIIQGDPRRGKSYGMNRLVERVDADVVVFTDANVVMDAAALLHLGPWFADPAVGCVCGNLVYINGDDTAMSKSGSLYWRLEERIKQLESDTFSVVGADGSIFAIRRALHEQVPDDIIDDFYLSMRILIRGYRVVREAKALAYERTATKTQEEFRRKVRIACQAFNVHRIIWPDIKRNSLLSYCYVSHRLLRWLGAMNLGAAALFFLASLFAVLPAFYVLAGLVLIGATFGALVAARVRIAELLLAIVVAFAGTGWGVWRSIRGDRFQTWTPTSTARGVGPK